MWFEILEQGTPIKRFKKVLNELSFSIGMMDVPETEIMLPYEYLAYLGDRKQIRIHMDGRTFLGYVDGIPETDTQQGTITVKVAHIAREWRFRQVPTNYAVKNLTISKMYEDGKLRYSESWNMAFDEVAAAHVVDYVFSRQNKLEALTKTCELTQDIWWRIGMNEDRKIEVGRFGEKKPYWITTHPTTAHNMQMIETPKITEDYSNVFNMATVYGSKSDSGASSMSLREVYENKDLQNPNFPVVIISSDINNERDYGYEQFTALAPNNDLEYSVIDIESVANESGLFIETTFAFEDLSPFSLEDENGSDASKLKDAGKWVIPQNQRYLTQAESEQNMRAFAGAMLALGATLQAIAAIAANIDRESGFNPNLFQGLNVNANPINQEGFGLVQWTPYTNITNWMQERGYTDYRTYGNAQVEKLHEEMETGQQWIDIGYGMTFQQFWTSKADPSYLAVVFERNYERGLYDHAATTGPRAIEIYNYLKEHQDELGKPANAGTYDDEKIKTKVVKLKQMAKEADGVWDPQLFIELYNGKSVDSDGVAGFQCVDTFKLILTILGDPDANRALGGDGYAHQIWYRFDALGYGAYFDRVSTPKLGDVAIFAASGETPDSHVAMYVSDAGGGRANFFGQNQGASYHNTVSLPTSNVLGYLRVKSQFWHEGGGDDPDPEPAYTPAEGGNGTNTIKDSDREQAAVTAYEATIKKLINARRTYEVNVKVGEIPADLNVGDMVQLGYNLEVTELANCSKHQQKILTMDRWWYVTAMECNVAADGTETWTLTLDKYLRLEREVQKQ